ncbi:hypothetical protein DP155_25030 [Salmonella enterica subsp. enterica serovar Typhimurium]|nr:hypothetical protein DP155_25030 [Salmonella enterica subsp. enterica serovar Typhimurium]
MFESPYANPYNPASDDVSDDNQLVILANKDRLEANDVALAEGLGVVEDAVKFACVSLPSSNSAIGASGMPGSVDCVSGVGTAIELGT